MRGKRAAIWAVVISATLITAGLILNCGDDNGNGNGEPDATWEDFCEKVVDCKLMDEGDLGECELWGEGIEEESGVDLTDLLNCTVDASCAHMGMDCWCKEYCERLIDCEIDYEEDELIFCLAECGSAFVLDSFIYVMEITMYVLVTPCDDIEP